MHLDMRNMKLKEFEQEDSLAFSKRDQEIVALTKRTKGITIFTEPTCNFCLAAKDVLRKRGWTYDGVSVPTHVSIKSLQQIAGNSVQTVPQVFLDGIYVGGYTKLVAHLGIPLRSVQMQHVDVPTKQESST